MKMISKKRIICAAVLAFVFAVNVFSAEKKIPLKFDKKQVAKDLGKKPFNVEKAADVVVDMTVGWNLGNTLDALGGGGMNSEISWGQPRTTREMIDGLASSGIKTLRLPVSWAAHMDKKTYTVQKEWMARVKEIVDWAIEDGMYVILNSHHDCFDRPQKMPVCSGYYPNSVNYEESANFLVNLWTQIGTVFNNGYDEHLVFETMNEPRLRGTGHEWWFDQNAEECRDAAETLNKLNQVSLDAIRATGGNNKKRFVMIPGLQASPDSALNSAFKMPVDDAPGKLILSVHMYSPYNFAMATPGDNNFTSAHKVELGSMFRRLNNSFILKGYPVVIGEMGATNKDNIADRVAWFEYFLTKSREYGMTSCLWDNGAPNPSKSQGERFGYYDRRKVQWYFPEITETVIKSTKKE